MVWPAGVRVRVRAMKPDSTIDEAMVTENWR